MTASYPYALAFARYQTTLEQDFARIWELADQARYEPVPGCPGWRGEDVLRHTAEVYLHKVEAIRRQERPDPWPPEHLGGEDALDLLDDAHRRLVAAFAAHDPNDPAWTWYPPDQTVGFWIRRMAHETAVHRHDVERAAGQTTAVAADLAVDGIDEVLELMLAGDWSPYVVDAASGGTVLVSSGGHDWAVTLDPSTVTVARHALPGAVARVTGEPGEVLLWLWGRGPLPGSEGDLAAVTELRDRLALATR